jgi:hypothetical protein
MDPLYFTTLFSSYIVDEDQLPSHVNPSPSIPLVPLVPFAPGAPVKLILQVQHDPDPSYK